MFRFLVSIFFIFGFCNVHAQIKLVHECKQKSFKKTVPPGNYSGITHISGNKYAVVSDKSPYDGFYIFSIDIDSITGELVDVRKDGFFSDSLRNGDCEGIAYCNYLSTLFICRETDSAILEYSLNGKLTGRELNVPKLYKRGMGNYGFESLAYDDYSQLFWTINESTMNSDGEQATSLNDIANKLRLLSFDSNLQPKTQYAYLMDSPVSHSKSSIFAMGVSELAAAGNGHLIVLEREFYVPKMKIGAYVVCKLYEIIPNEDYAMKVGESINDNTKFIPKHLICSFITKLKPFRSSLANYEGMCLGPTLVDGSRTIILISDSQNQYAGVLKDWFKTIVISNSDINVK